MKKNSELEKQLNRLRHQKNLLWLGILLFVLVILWILLSIFTSSRTSTITPELKELAKPFVPRLESNIFADIQGQRTYTQGEIGFFPIYVIDKDNLDAELKFVDITKELIESEQTADAVDVEVEQLSGDAESTNSATPSPAQEEVGPVEAIVSASPADAE